VHQALLLLVREAGGGILFGLVLGYATFRLLKSVDDYEVEVMLTLAAVTGGYLLASKLHVSGPLAMVVVGLMIGNQGRALAMSDTTRRYLDMFWELLDQILNAVLFVLMGMEVLRVTFGVHELVAAALAVAGDVARARTGRRPARGGVAARLQSAARVVEGAHLGRGCAAASRWRWRCRCPLDPSATPWSR
jgi:CPA1 family monovalent cation:H+ antiporter